MGQIHCKTCTCQESSRPRTGEFSCPNCFRPNNSEGWLRWHLKNQCEASPAQAREGQPKDWDNTPYSKGEWHTLVKLGYPNQTNITDEEYIAKYGPTPMPKPKRAYNAPTRW